ncbi:NACHT, LRR and PYD domains-containing protein 3-like isoform X1 [Gopherus flavomarginatus]|uniref:NACHT, LRR and PYD domains-containing protein 3-like isoform X1 n=1 Tax=Gopherus flavomarginatus TaxID=286002 RepID=UPI0021CC4C58|nr:NACHT, LRR and PYD domains-containing protein 3-like isoform X1 [Gopherus flavomarginatus]
MGNQSSRISDLLVHALNNLTQGDFKRFKDKLSYSALKGRGNIPRDCLDNANRIDTKNLLMKFYGGEAAVDVTIDVFTQINLRDSAAKLREGKEKGYRKKYKEDVKNKYEVIQNMTSLTTDNVILNRRYPKLIILDDPLHAKEREHEIMAMSRRDKEIKTKPAWSVVTIDTLFTCDKQGQTPQIVVLLGAAGIGKTMTTRKIMCDWAAGELYKKKFDYVFYINCRETNLTEQGSVVDMILKNWPNTNAPVNEILMKPEKLLFIIDGFDELRFSFDQTENLCSDPWEKKPMEIILSSLFRKMILPQSYLLITSRPTALEKLLQCLECSHYAEILGFSEADRKEYFHKFFGNKKQARQALQFVKANDILFTMCFIPIMCWIICTVVKQQLEKGEDLAQTSKSVTGVYMLYISSLVKPLSSNSKQHMQANLRGLCSLAAYGIWKRKILFEEAELKKFGLNQADSFPLSLNKNIFQKDIDCVNAYSFIHLSFQEFFAALFYVLEEDEETMEDSETPKKDMKTLLENYGNSRNYLMLTVRFLFGLLNEEIMQIMEEKFSCKISPKIKPDLLKWVQTNQQKYLPLSNVYQETCRIYNLEEFHCMFEMYEENFVKSALDHVVALTLDSNKLTQMDQMAFSFCVKNCHRLQSLCISYCTFAFGDHGEDVLPRRQKWLYQIQHWNEPKHSPIYLLCQVLKDPNCKLKKLELVNCSLTAACCRDLSSVLNTKTTLTELDLSYKVLGNSGIKLLCEGLKHPNCKVQKLRVQYCCITGAACGDLAAVLRTNQSLTELNLNGNPLGDSGVQRLCEGLKHPSCKLQRLWLEDCHLKDTCGRDLAAVLRTKQSLTELEMCRNYDLRETAVQQLCEGLKHPNCKLQRLILNRCKLTDACCGALSSVLSTSQTLTELVLGYNEVGDPGVQLLCEGLKHPNCRLQILNLSLCQLTAACCGDLASALSTNQTLTELNIGGHSLGASGVQLLCEGLKHPNCKLQKLGLWSYDIIADLNAGDSRAMVLCRGMTFVGCDLRNLLVNCFDISKEKHPELYAVKKIKPELYIW